MWISLMWMLLLLLLGQVHGTDQRMLIQKTITTYSIQHKFKSQLMRRCVNEL